MTSWTWWSPSSAPWTPVEEYHTQVLLGAAALPTTAVGGSDALGAHRRQPAAPGRLPLQRPAVRNPLGQSGGPIPIPGSDPPCSPSCGTRYCLRPPSGRCCGPSCSGRVCTSVRLPEGARRQCMPVHRRGPLDDAVGKLLVEAVTPLASEVALAAGDSEPARAGSRPRAKTAPRTAGLMAATCWCR